MFHYHQVAQDIITDPKRTLIKKIEDLKALACIAFNQSPEATDITQLTRPLLFATISSTYATPSEIKAPTPIEIAELDNGIPEIEKKDAKPSDVERQYMAKWLIKNGADINARQIQGQTPLMIAIIKGNITMAKFCIRSSAKLDDQDKEGYSVYRHILRSSFTMQQKAEMYALLKMAGVPISKADATTLLSDLLTYYPFPEQKQMTDVTETAATITNKSEKYAIDILRHLVSCEADINQQPPGGPLHTPLIYAVNKQATDIVAYLANEAKADCSIVDTYGRTAMAYAMLAVFRTENVINKRIVEILLPHHYCDFILKKTSEPSYFISLHSTNNQTALMMVLNHLAHSQNSTPYLIKLINQCINATPESNTNLSGSDSIWPYATKANNAKIMQQLLDKFTPKPSLLHWGETDETPLIIALTKLVDPEMRVATTIINYLEKTGGKNLLKQATLQIIKNPNDKQRKAVEHLQRHHLLDLTEMSVEDNSDPYIKPYAPLERPLLLDAALRAGSYEAVEVMLQDSKLDLVAASNTIFSCSFVITLGIINLKHQIMKQMTHWQNNSNNQVKLMDSSKPHPAIDQISMNRLLLALDNSHSWNKIFSKEDCESHIIAMIDYLCINGQKANLNLPNSTGPSYRFNTKQSYLYHFMKQGLTKAAARLAKEIVVAEYKGTHQYHYNSTVAPYEVLCNWPIWDALNNNKWDVAHAIAQHINTISPDELVLIITHAIHANDYFYEKAKLTLLTLAERGANWKPTIQAIEPTNKEAAIRKQKIVSYFKLNFNKKQLQPFCDQEIKRLATENTSTIERELYQAMQRLDYKKFIEIMAKIPARDIGKFKGKLLGTALSFWLTFDALEKEASAPIVTTTTPLAPINSNTLEVKDDAKREKQTTTAAMISPATRSTIPTIHSIDDLLTAIEQAEAGDAYVPFCPYSKWDPTTPLSPLHLAFITGNKPLIKRLLRYLPHSQWITKDENGQTPWECGAISENEEILTYANLAQPQDYSLYMAARKKEGSNEDYDLRSKIQHELLSAWDGCEAATRIILGISTLKFSFGKRTEYLLTKLKNCLENLTHTDYKLLQEANATFNKNRLGVIMETPSTAPTLENPVATPPHATSPRTKRSSNIPKTKLMRSTTFHNGIELQERVKEENIAKHLIPTENKAQINVK